MKIKIYNYETKNLITTQTVNEKDNVFEIIRKLEVRQMTEDILNIGKLGRANYHINKLGQKGCIHSNMDDTSNIEVGRNCTTIGGNNKIAAPDNLTIDDEDMKIKIGVVIYKEGWVLSIGKKTYDIFGGQHDAYLKSIGSRNIHASGIDAARKFKTIKALIDYVVKNQSVLEFCAKQYGYHWDYAPICDIFEKDFEDNLSKTQKEKYENNKQVLNSILESINNVEDEEDEIEEDIPTEINDDTINEEVISRMTKLHLWNNIITRYKKDKTIFMSETAGIIYELNEDAKKAANYVKEMGYTPYHIIRTNTTFGELYAVLYVSNNTEDWTLERYNEKDNIITSCVYNKDTNSYEFGDIGISPANGGIVRTA